MFRGVSLNSLIIGFSKTLDLIDSKLYAHHWDVAYIALRIARQLGWEPKRIQTIVQAALIHDIGVFKTDDRKMLLDYQEIETVGHEQIGVILLEQSKLLTDLIPIVRNHHQAYDQWKPDTPEEAGVLYLADRIAVLINKRQSAEENYQTVIEKLKGDRDKRFKAQYIDAFLEVAQNKAFWLDILMNRIEPKIRSGLVDDVLIDSFEEVMAVGNLFISAVDFRSRYTAAHSYAVSKIARLLGELMGMGEDTCNILEITGFYHDIGKIAIPKEILDKPDKLTQKEREIIVGHSYFTYDILSKVEGLQEYAEIAAYHHESLDGHGYPFGVNRDELDTLCRVVAIADLFTAVTENRPYRETIDPKVVKSIFLSKVEDGKIDEQVTQVVLEHFDYLVAENNKWQREAYQRFEEFEKKVFEQTGIVL